MAACSARLGSGFISFVEGVVCIFCISITPMKAGGDNYMQVTQSDLLDQFNFLALTGTAAHRAPKKSSSYMLCKSRLYTYELLRAIANGEHRDDQWMTLVEAGAMMRSTANDKFLKICSKVALRLIKDP